MTENIFYIFIKSEPTKKIFMDYILQMFYFIQKIPPPKKKKNRKTQDHCANSDQQLTEIKLRSFPAKHAFRQKC